MACLDWCVLGDSPHQSRHTIQGQDPMRIKKRKDVCKQELIIIETYTSFNHNNKSYYHCINKTFILYHHISYITHQIAYIASHQIISYHISYHIIYIISYHIISYHIILYYIILYYIILYYIILYYYYYSLLRPHWTTSVNHFLVIFIFNVFSFRMAQ